APILTKELVKSFKDSMKENNISAGYIHTPYYINLASIKDRIRNGSIEVIRDDLERASILGIPYIMTHLGSANDLPRDKAIKQVTAGISKIMKGYKGSAMFLVENSAGSGNIIGDRFEEINEIISKLPKKYKKKIGVCLDTCHAFASGYDLRDKKSVEKTLNEFNKHIGLKLLKLIHLNDSKTDLGGKVDRHENIGKGKIGLNGLTAFVNHPKLKNMPMVLETPMDDLGGHTKDIKLIKKIRK
ncbi:deoxyribonuclease IV, partial [bacterium]|nr:deoxyribonuclease IV [bacterium]